MRHMRHVVLGLFAAVALLAADAPSEVVDQVQGANAEVNWTKGIIYATGMGPLPRTGVKNHAIQRRVALVDGYRQLAEAAKGVRVTSETTIEMLELTKDVATARVDAFIKAFQVVDEGWMKDNPTTYYVRLAIHLAAQDKDSLASVVLPTATQREPEVQLEEARKEAAKLPENKRPELPPVQVKPVEVPVTPPVVTPPPERKAGPYTGLVVDMRGFKCERAMAPKIVTKDEDEVWGTVQVSREFVLDTGIVGYLPSLEMALNPDQSRAGANPLVIRGIGLHGSFRANAVITDDDASLIKSENGKSKFLDKFKVVFVVDAK